jgi:phage baseplate assembly protein W
MQKRQFQGFPYPVVKTPLGFFPVQNGTDQIKSDLLILLLTNPGERVMLPDYGTGLREFLFEQRDSIVTEQIISRISRSIEKWEPRVAITDITASVNSSELASELSGDTSHVVLVKISFRDPNDLQSIESLVFELPI